MNKNIVSQQLNAASQIILSSDGAEFCSGLLDVCGELVNLVAAQLCNDGADAESIKEITSCLIYISKGLEGIAVKAGGTDCLKVSTEYVSKLANAVTEHRELIEKEKKAKKDLETIEADIKALKPQVEILDTEFRNQTEFKKSLERKLEEVSEENITALKDLNEELVTKFVAQETEYKGLVEAQDKHNKNMEELEKKILSMPEEKALAEEYDRIENYYKHLLTAKEECSEEKQLELQEKIAKLVTDVKGLEEAMVLLREREAEIAGAKTSIETEKGIFETEFIQKIEESMNDLKNNMSSHRKRLNDIKDSAAELKKHIDECEAIHKNYSFMFEACKAPLKAIATASKTEYGELLKTYDISKSTHVKDLKAGIEKNLEELGKIIDECRKATMTDQEALKVKAFGKGMK